MPNGEIPRKETLTIGALFICGMAPLIAINVWVALLAVAKFKSGLFSAVIIIASSLIVMFIAAVLERILLSLDFKRCLREALAAGWGVIAPCAFVYYWNLPKNLEIKAIIAMTIVFLTWIVVFWHIFSANKPDK